MYRILLFCLTLSLSACSQSTFDQTIDQYLNYTVDTISVEKIDSTALNSWKFIDARSLAEFQTSKIKGAQFLDFDNPDYSSLNIDSTDTIVVYCTIGYRSEKIAEVLKEKGFQNVFNMYGGILAWANYNNALYSPLGLPTSSVHTYDASWGKWLVNPSYTAVH